MTLFILTIPLMVLAVGLAAFPLVAMSIAEHRRRTSESAGATGAWPRPQIEDENVSVVPSAGAP
jgi:hypothetical protein